MASSPYEERPNKPYDYEQDQGLVFSGGAMETQQDIYGNPYDIEVVLGQVRPVAAEAIQALNLNHWQAEAGHRSEFVEQVVPRITPHEQFVFDILSLHEQSTDEKTIVEFIEEVSEKHSLREDPNLTSYLVDLHKTRDVTEEFSGKITGAIEQVMDADETSRADYIVAKMLAAHPGVTVDDLEAIVVQDLVAVGAEFEATDLYGELKCRVASGEFDYHIAEDLLYGNIIAPEKSDEKTRQALGQMIGMTERLLRTEDKHKVIERLTEEGMLQLWSPDARRTFDAAKKELADAIQRRFTNRRDFAYSAGILLKQASPANIERYITKFPASTKGATRKDGQITSTEAVRLNVKRRQGNRAKPMGGTALKGAKAKTKETDTPPVRKLFSINSRGEVFDDQSDEFKTMIREYIAEHPHEENELKAAVGSAFEYLRDPVRTNGYARGIQPIKEGSVKFGPNSKRHKLYRFRPNQGTGVSASCKTAQKMRILFVMDPDNGNNIHLMGISDKDAISKLYRKFGVANIKDKRR